MAVLNKEPTVLELASDALANYFRPLSYLAELGGGRITDKLAKEVSRLSNTDRSAIALIRKSVCFNQGAFLQYSFLSAEKHKKLKDYYREFPDDAGGLDRLVTDLTNHVNKTLYEVCYENFLFLHAYFESTGRSSPRVCVKGSFDIHGTEKVITVFRDVPVAYDSNTNIDGNSGFEFVKRRGTYFLENDLPHVYAQGKYRNPRLAPIKDVDRDSLLHVREHWSDMWKYGEREDERSSAYKSTLIVPMTLWNNELTDEFKTLVNLEKVDRTIFGFLCFDHEEVGYFDEENDVGIGYVVADILSMYVFTRLVYCDISATFHEVVSHLRKVGRKSTSDKLKAVWKEVPSAVDSKSVLDCEYRETTDNKLVSVDENLFNFVNADIAER